MGGYITLEELLQIRKEQEISLEIYDEKAEKKALKKAERARLWAEFSSRFWASFRQFGKKAVFTASMPLYWFVIFKYLVGWFSPGFFIFVVACSAFMSAGGNNWGLISAMMK